ncbi:hypothetical protein C2134_02965 [Chromobacterium sinusclupearum]|uniref:Uncharacterized protein n=1 Tax=Chromobacterium sinusclupearum TaxID=2077146 RepID=A0A2K4MT62_9NEIS|nr:hypothetical protein [Chromobacterium sinusclupearum]POB00170.1 hypothetical protein C2134_02965 [Chromobacterium sinusclupearum]
MSRISIIEYDEAGCIVQVGIAPLENVELEFAMGKALLQGEADPAQHYVRDGEILLRPDNPARLDGLTLHSLPVPCRIIIDGQSYDCADAECELSFAHPGRHSITVEAWPARAASWEVES